MKLIKIGVAAIVLVFILNALGLLNPKLGKTVDTATKVAREKIQDQWGDMPFDKVLENNLFQDLVGNTVPVKFKKVDKGIYSIRGNQYLSGTYNNNEPISLEIAFDATDTVSVRQAEAVISLYRGKKFQFIPEQIKGATTVKIKIIRDGQQFKIESNLPVKIKF